MPATNQQLEPSKPHHSLKPLYWIIPIVILAALAAGYFVYQDYAFEKTVRDTKAPSPGKSFITKEQAIDFIAQNYPTVVEARGGVGIPDEFIEKLADGWQINFYWGLCPKCRCLFKVNNNGSIEVKDKGEDPSLCERTEASEIIKEDDSEVFETMISVGTIEPVEGTVWQYGTHTLEMDGNILYALTSDTISLDDYNGKTVEVQSRLKEGYPVDFGPLYMEVDAVKEIKQGAQIYDPPLSLVGVYTYGITSMCSQACEKGIIFPFYELTEPLFGKEPGFGDVEVVWVKGRLVEEERLPTIAGPFADTSNFGQPVKTTLLKVEEYKKIDFPKISLSQAELERYLKNEDSAFLLEFENPFSDELTISFAFDLSDATPPATTIVLKPLARTKTFYIYKGNEGSEYTRTPEDNFEITATGGDKMEKLLINGKLQIPDRGRIIYVNRFVYLEDVIEK